MGSGAVRHLAEQWLSEWLKAIHKTTGAELSRPDLVLRRCGRRFLCSYRLRTDTAPAQILINLDGIRPAGGNGDKWINAPDRIRVDVGHNMVHHYIAETETYAGSEGHGYEFRRICHRLGLNTRGRSAMPGPPPKLPKSKAKYLLWQCRCPAEKRYAVRAVFLHAQCLECGYKFSRADRGQIETGEVSGIDIGVRVRIKSTGHHGRVVRVKDTAKNTRRKRGLVAVEKKSGKVEYYRPDQLRML